MVQVYRRDITSNKLTSIDLYTWVERDTVRENCLSTLQGGKSTAQLSAQSCLRAQVNGGAIAESRWKEWRTDNEARGDVVRLIHLYFCKREVLLEYSFSELWNLFLEFPWKLFSMLIQLIQLMFSMLIQLIQLIYICKKTVKYLRLFLYHFLSTKNWNCSISYWISP